ncbi:Hypothetical predicted protein [Marmota monax]|uniref:Uncharacterized protein n=1 Tax=Marmota monax TaxID=9995 RepID=A0A5E4BFC1_MARMO|nr:hypothetical protein GHT09_002881 [Marmota monax]VTJ68075.1 Hypothetical predicted protein [Marmota monax]
MSQQHDTSVPRCLHLLRALVPTQSDKLKDSQNRVSPLVFCSEDTWKKPVSQGIPCCLITPLCAKELMPLSFLSKLRTAMINRETGSFTMDVKAPLDKGVRSWRRSQDGQGGLEDLLRGPSKARSPRGTCLAKACTAAGTHAWLFGSCRVGWVSPSRSSSSSAGCLLLGPLKRVLFLTNDYFFTDISDTPFSLGVVLSQGHGEYVLLGNTSVEEGLHDLLHPDLTVANDWIYCITDIDPDHRKLSQLEAMVRFLTGEDPDLECDEELVREVLFDAVVTAPMEAYWTALALNISE